MTIETLITFSITVIVTPTMHLYLYYKGKKFVCLVESVNLRKYLQTHNCHLVKTAEIIELTYTDCKLSKYKGYFPIWYPKNLSNIITKYIIVI